MNHNLLSYQHSSLLINISFLPCPYGLQTGQISEICECNDVIKGLGNTDCNISLMPHPISRQLVIHEHCPFDTVRGLGESYIIN